MLIKDSRLANILNVQVWYFINITNRYLRKVSKLFAPILLQDNSSYTEMSMDESRGSTPSVDVSDSPSPAPSSSQTPTHPGYTNGWAYKLLIFIFYQLIWGNLRVYNECAIYDRMFLCGWIISFKDFMPSQFVSVLFLWSLSDYSISCWC